MNKLITVALIAGGLLLLDSPKAAAHQEIRNVYQPSAYYRVEHRRAKHMPRWLKRDRSFRHWYKRTHLRRHRYLAWHQLFDIYRWERRNLRHNRRNDRHMHRHHRGHNDDWKEYRYDNRNHDRHDRRGRRH